MTQLCASIFVHTVNQALADAARAAEMGADIVEFRIDLLTDEQMVRDIVSRAIVKCIVTCRPTWEGGLSEALDDDRLRLLFKAMEATQDHRDMYDVELVTYRRSAIYRSPERAIVSYHDFTGRPDRLYQIFEDLNDTLAGAVKIAWRARSIRDNIEAFELLRSKQKPSIVLCMGEAGLISRVLAKKFGGFLTFASVDPTSVTAPGQPTIEQFNRDYRWDAIGRDTKVFGVVGSPIAHSMSPTVHNAAFDALNFDGVYLPMLVENSYESFKAFMISFVDFGALDLAGLSITLPHKENALRYLKEIGAHIDPLAESIGAVNTITIECHGGKATLRGSNTDHDAILDTITNTLSISRDELADLRIAVIGAGGTARTAVTALAGLGATVVVYNRTLDRAETLANEFNGRVGRVVAARMEKLCDSCCHVFINCTPVGMYPNRDESPLGDRLPKFSPDTLVFDTIYNPPRTKLLQQAEAVGAKSVGGAEMFIHQAAAQFQGWTGKPAPRDAMRRAFDARLINQQFDLPQPLLLARNLYWISQRSKRC